MTPWIPASHADGELDAETELRQAQTDRLLARERARDAHRQPQADPQPSAEKKP
jgi:hypothetical protein